MGVIVPADEAHDEPFPCWALVVIACEAEPERVGQAFVVPPGEGEAVLGRGMAEDAGAPKLQPICQHPGFNEPAEPLSLPGVSRRQLRLRVDGEGLHVEVVGRCAVRVDGEALHHGRLHEGSVVEVGEHIAFVCVRRPELLAASEAFPASHAPPFGEADRFGLVGESPALWILRDRTAFVAAHEDHVVLLGSDRSVMGRVAQAIHALSRRSGRAFVLHDSGRLAQGVSDEALWGQAAEGGTVVLESVDELRDSVRARVLERFGGGGTIPGRHDPRLVLTTRDPAGLPPELVARVGLRLWVPSLRERCEDVPLLARHLLRRLAAQDRDRIAPILATGPDGRSWPRLDTELVSALVRHEGLADDLELEALLATALEGRAGDRLVLTADVAAMLGR